MGRAYSISIMVKHSKFRKHIKQALVAVPTPRPLTVKYVEFCKLIYNIRKLIIRTKNNQPEVKT